LSSTPDNPDSREPPTRLVTSWKRALEGRACWYPCPCDGWRYPVAADQLSVLPGWPGSPPAARVPARWFAVPVGGKPAGMRFGNLEVRPLGGGLGCLFMVLFSVVASVVLTVLVNLLLR
jgi:hypothetical protein